ncbi:hypothetical protein [Streptomyces vinaceus]|uniref:hypothetical protein n=1 Tax=Streptomyces vinaceus TaxID=1960 RepID=UPI00382A7ECC
MPEHLLGPLQEWVQHALEHEALTADYGDQDETERSLCLALRITAKPRSKRREVGSKYYWALAESAGPRLLDVVAAVLAYKAKHGVDEPQSVRRLIRLLEDAGSAYRVAWSADGLEERVTPGVRDAVHRTIADAAAAASAGSAADHLAEPL